MKQINLTTIINLLRREESMTRNDLAKRSGLTSAAVANLISELTETGYIECIGEGESVGGRRPKLIRLRPNGDYSVGLELTTSHVIVVVGNLRADILGQSTQAISPEMERNAVIDIMVDCVERAVAQSGLPREAISGLGLAVPGPCDYGNGIMLNPPNLPAWNQVPIREIMARRTGFDTFMCKETAAAALAECWFGKALGDERVFTFFIDTVGVGGAFVEQGDIYQANGLETMDIGHITVQTDGFRCSCGNRGCLEAQVSGYATVQYANRFLADSRGRSEPGYAPTAFMEVLEGFGQGNEACVYAIETCARYLAAALRNMVLLLRPDRVFFGGNFAELCPQLVELVRARVNTFSYPDCACIPIEPFSFGRNNGAIGATALVFSGRLDNR